MLKAKNYYTLLKKINIQRLTVAEEPKLKLPAEPILPVLVLDDPKLNPALFSPAALPKLNIPFGAEFCVGFVNPNVGVA